MSQPPPAMRLALDVSLDRLDAALRAPDGSWAITHQAVPNTQPGYETLKQTVLAQLQQHAATHLVVSLESTGSYWWHVAYQMSHDAAFDPYDLQLYVLNPRHVKHFRQALAEQDKTDPLDPQLIEQYQRSTDRPTQHPYTFQERYLPLRQFTRAYCRLSHTLAREKASCLSLLYLVASEYARRKPFSDLFGVASQTLLQRYPDLSVLADLPTDELADLLQSWARGHLTDATATAQQVQQAATDSFPLPAALRATLQDLLQLTLARVRFLEQQKRALHDQIVAQLDHLPEAQPALAVKGLGPLLVAGCLSEIGHTQRFLSGQKYDRTRNRYRPKRYRDGQAAVAKLAGLWWPTKQSGRWHAEQRRLARERNPYLRYWLVQAAYVLKGQQDDYAAYYQKKYREATHHRHQRALLLTARKAVRLLFALLHKGQTQRQEEVAPA